MSSLAEFRALLEEVRSEPYADTPRQLLADWLQDHNDPRGEFLFVQVRRMQLAPDDPEQAELAIRERQLLHTNAFHWLGPLVDLSSSWTFSRGLLNLEARAGRILTDDADELALQGAFDWVETLWLRDVRAEHLSRIKDSPILERLICLDLSFNRLDDASLSRLEECRRLIFLRELRLAGNRITSGGVGLLAEWSQLEGLLRLDLSRNRINTPGGFALARSEHLDEMRVLDLRGNRILHPGQVALQSRFGSGVLLGET